MSVFLKLCEFMLPLDGEDEALAMPIVNCSSFSRLFLATQPCFRILDIFGTPC